MAGETVAFREAAGVVEGMGEGVADGEGPCVGAVTTEEALPVAANALSLLLGASAGTSASRQPRCHRGASNYPNLGVTQKIAHLCLNASCYILTHAATVLMGCGKGRLKQDGDGRQPDQQIALKTALPQQVPSFVPT